MEKNNGNSINQTGQTIIVNQTDKKSNGIGTAGFVLSVIAIFFGWIPVLGQVIWLLGLIFSFAGIFKSPKGLSIAGLAISIVGFLLLIFVLASI
jgi:hypothetical protein